MTREGAGDRELLIYSLIDSNKLAYLQLVTGLVYRGSPPKVTDRSGGPAIFYKKGILRNFTKFTGKHYTRDSSLIKLQG